VLPLINQAATCQGSEKGKRTTTQKKKRPCNSDSDKHFMAVPYFLSERAGARGLAVVLPGPK
jgi:hypothetical protein